MSDLRSRVLAAQGSYRGACSALITATKEFNESAWNYLTARGWARVGIAGDTWETPVNRDRALYERRKAVERQLEWDEEAGL